ncbi:hypothetical protein JCM10450v2_003306 [Rhodotorula kratochvilovae]
MSLSTLPYDVVRTIVDFLDPSPIPSAAEAPSTSRARRDVGRTAALIARNFRRAGTELVWRNVVVGFHRNPDLLERILRDEWMASHVKQLQILVSKRDEDKAMQLDLARVFILLDRLTDCILLVTPTIALRLLSRAAQAPNIPHFTYLEVDTTASPSAAYPAQLLSVLPLSTGAKRIAVSLRVPAGSLIPLPQGTPVLRTCFITLAIEDLKPDAYPAASSFLTSYLSLFDPSHVQNLVLFSDCIPSTTLDRFLRAAHSLTVLTLYLSTTDLLPLLESITAALPALPALRRLKLALSSFSAPPPALDPAHPARGALFATLALPDSRVVLVALDVDFGARDALVRALEEVSARGARLREWRSVEWDAMLEVRREVSWEWGAVAEESGREGWRRAEGQESDED